MNHYSPGDDCPYCHGTGKRKVRYRVEAEVDYELDHDEGVTFHLLDNWDYSILCDDGVAAAEALAKKLLQAHQRGEKLPGVTVTEITEEPK